MALQNRVTPFAEIVADPARGNFMGNRGTLHNERREIRLGWTTLRWITCLLEFKGRHREVMTPGRYTELFFLDEATAFAAGHRPCAECRRADYRRFLEAWRAGNTAAHYHPGDRIEVLDAILHAERVGPAGANVTFAARLAELPDGVMLTRTGEPGVAYLKWEGSLHPWSHGGYLPPVALSPGETVSVLTPRSIVNAFTAGYVPAVHPSALSGGAASTGSRR